jgi:hypothetical protein
MFRNQLSMSNILQTATNPGLGYGKDKSQTQLDVFHAIFNAY